MESINTLKGYGKVSDNENQIQSPIPSPKSYSRKTLIATVSVVSLLLILAVVALTAGAFTRPSHPPSVSAKSLKAVCAVTGYPETCFTSLSSAIKESEIQKFDPELILELSLKIAAKEVSNLEIDFRSIDDMPEDAAVGDCVKLYDDAVSQLNESISEIETEKKKGGNWLTNKVIGDVKTWISAAMTDGETCSDGLEEMGSIVGEEIKKEMKMANQKMSISLAIVSQIKKLLILFH